MGQDSLPEVAEHRVIADQLEQRVVDFPPVRHINADPGSDSLGAPTDHGAWDTWPTKVIWRP